MQKRPTKRRFGDSVYNKKEKKIEKKQKPIKTSYWAVMMSYYLSWFIYQNKNLLFIAAVGLVQHRQHGLCRLWTFVSFDVVAAGECGWIACSCYGCSWKKNQTISSPTRKSGAKKNSWRALAEMCLPFIVVVLLWTVVWSLFIRLASVFFASEDLTQRSAVVHAFSIYWLTFKTNENLYLFNSNAHCEYLSSIHSQTHLLKW